MKNFLISVLIALFASTSFVQAEQIQTKFSAPFQNINIDTNMWSVIKKDMSTMLFRLKEDVNTSFFIFQGFPIETTPHSEFVNQLLEARGNLIEVPLFMASFPFIEMEEENMDIIVSWAEVIINGRAGIKMHNLEECETPTKDEKSIYSEEKGLTYLFLLENQMYLICFTTPQEKFPELESIFENTVQNLW